MYENYGFVLEWDDLSDDLKEKKIDAKILYDLDNNNYANRDFESMEYEDLIENLHLRDEVEDEIRCYFPIYF